MALESSVWRERSGSSFFFFFFLGGGGLRRMNCRSPPLPFSSGPTVDRGQQGQFDTHSVSQYSRARTGSTWHTFLLADCVHDQGVCREMRPWFCSAELPASQGGHCCHCSSLPRFCPKQHLDQQLDQEQWSCIFIGSRSLKYIDLQLMHRSMPDSTQDLEFFSWEKQRQNHTCPCLHWGSVSGPWAPIEQTNFFDTCSLLSRDNFCAD